MKNCSRTTGMILALATIMGLVFTPIPASACSNLGPEKHMGVVRLVNPIKGTLSLIDAETRRTIEFVVGKNLIHKVGVNDTVVVTFEQKDQLLVAKAIVVHTSAKGLL